MDANDWKILKSYIKHSEQKKNKSYFIFNIKKNVSKLKFVVKNTINLFSMKTFLYKVNQILDQNISRESMIFKKNELCHFPFICTKQVKKANFKTILSFFMFNSFFCYHQFIGWAIFSRGIEYFVLPSRIVFCCYRCHYQRFFKVIRKVLQKV